MSNRKSTPHPKPRPEGNFSMVRELTVQYQLGTISPEPRPMLRLAGIWLRQAGFDIGDHVAVFVGKDRLVIQKVGGQDGEE